MRGFFDLPEEMGKLSTLGVWILGLLLWFVSLAIPVLAIWKLLDLATYFLGAW
jgi:hypothetical protein